MAYTPFKVPEALTKPYTGDRYISREPFLMNTTVDDSGKMRLRDEKIGPDRVFMGVAGFRALDLLAIAGRDQEPDERYQQALLFDMNEQQVKAMNNILSMIDSCDTPADFKKAFRTRYLKWVDHIPDRQYAKEPHSKERQQRLAEEQHYFAVMGRKFIPEDAQQLNAYFQRENDNNDSWLQPENYRIIKGLVKKGRIATATLDIRDEERFRTLKKDWADKGLVLGHAYLSSLIGMLSQVHVVDYFGEERAAGKPDIAKLRDNFLSLGDPKSRFLNSRGIRPKIHKPGEDVPAPKDQRLFALVSCDRKEFEELCEDSLSTAPIANDDRTFSIGKTTYQTGSHPAFADRHHESYRLMMPLLQPRDRLVTIRVSSNPSVLGGSELLVIKQALRPYAQRYGVQLCIPAVKSPETGGEEYDRVTVRIPEETMAHHPRLTGEIRQLLEAAVKTVSPDRSAGR